MWCRLKPGQVELDGQRGAQFFGRRTFLSILSIVLKCCIPRKEGGGCRLKPGQVELDGRDLGGADCLLLLLLSAQQAPLSF